MRRLNPVLLFLGVLGVASSWVHAADQLPGEPQRGPILLAGGDVYTVSGDIIRGGQVLFDEGRIVGVGKSVQSPSDVKRIDVAGKRVYPGLFASGNDLGLVEVRSVRGARPQGSVMLLDAGDQLTGTPLTDLVVDGSKGGAMHALSWRSRHIRNRKHPVAGGATRSIHAVTNGFLPQRLPQERGDATGRRADQQ